MGWRRRLYRGGNLQRAVSIADLRARAMRRVPGFVFEYVEGGSDDEFALRNNRESFDEWQFVPSTLVHTADRHQRVALFGKEVASPLIVGPTGGNGVLQPNGDLSLARAAAAAGLPFCLSTMSSIRLEELPKQAGGRLWMQLYMTHNRQSAEDIIARADAAGYEALVFTTDANVFGQREWDRRNYARPGMPTWRNRPVAAASSEMGLGGAAASWRATAGKPCTLPAARCRQRHWRQHRHPQTLFRPDHLGGCRVAAAPVAAQAPHQRGDVGGRCAARRRSWLRWHRAHQSWWTADGPLRFQHWTYCRKSPRR